MLPLEENPMIPKQIPETEPRHTTGKTNILKTRVATAVVSREHRATWLPAVALLVLIAYFAFQQPAFLSPLNLTVMGAQAGPLLLISLGATFIVLMGSIDLSVAAVAALASAISAVLLQKLGTSYATAFLAVLGFGIAAGLLNSVLSTVLRLPS
ncbi:ABC transporter permease subunit, partial [Agrobacterium vitis]